MADEPTNQGLTSEQAESNRLAAQGNEYGKQEVDLANKSFALQRLGISDTVQKLQEVNESVQDNQQTTMERFTDGYKKMVEGLYEQSRVFNNVGGAIKNDFGKLGLAFAPLTSIPGVETAMVLVKSILAKLFVFLISKDKKDAALAKLRAMKDRAKAIGGKVVRGAKAVKENPKAVGKGLFIGLGAAISVFVRGFISGFQMQLARILSFFNFKKLGLSLQNKAFANLKKMQGTAIKAANNIAKLLTPLNNLLPKSVGTSLAKVSGPFKAVSQSIPKVIQVLKSVLTFAGKFGIILGRIFAPIQIIIGLYEAITGFMDGFKKYEGQGFVTQMFAGISQGIGDLAGFLIGWPLDFLKSVVAGIGNLFGFDMSMLEDFSFQDEFSKLGTFIGDWIAGFIDGIKTSIADIGIGGLLKNITLSMIKIFKKIAMFPAAVASGAVLGLAAAWPGGETPGEAFMRGFNGVFNAGDAAIDSFRTEADGLDEEGNVIEQQSEATADAKTNTNAESNTNNAVVNTTVNNTAGKKVYTTKANQPADDFGYRLAYS
jgi:hypothetical protein